MFRSPIMVLNGAKTGEKDNCSSLLQTVVKMFGMDNFIQIVVSFCALWRCLLPQRVWNLVSAFTVVVYDICKVFANAHTFLTDLKLACAFQS